ncbi:MAG: PTS sugar transporter subunit IIA [Nevskiales bacterium]
MNIGEIVRPEQVQFQPDIHSKKRALEEISRLLAAGAPALEADDILGSLTSREKLGSTGLGGGVAIPHGRMRGIDNSVGAFLRIGEGVDYEASDGRKVDLVFGLLVPQNCNEEHLKILAQLAEMFLDEAFCSKARATSDARQLHELLVNYVPAATT